jgi:hypothetical protein
MTELLCAAKREAHPCAGARKLLAVLQAKHPRIPERPAPRYSWADLLARRGSGNGHAPAARRSILVS